MASLLNSANLAVREDGPYGMPNALFDGCTSVRSQLEPSHPLELKEKYRKMTMEQLNFKLLRTTQGIHAPLRLTMEKQAAAKVQRLPFLPSSNAMLETLDGSDETITFDDILNDPTQPERMGPPHIMVEKYLKLI